MFNSCRDIFIKSVNTCHMLVLQTHWTRETAQCCFVKPDVVLLVQRPKQSPTNHKQTSLTFPVSYPGDSLQVEGEQVRIHSDEVSIKLLQTHKPIRFSNRLK